MRPDRVPRAVRAVAAARAPIARYGRGRSRRLRLLFGLDEYPIQFPGRQRELHRAVGIFGIADRRIGVPRPIRRCPVHLEPRDLDPGGGEFFVVLGHLLGDLRRRFRFQNAVGACFQLQRRLAGVESGRIFGEARQGVEYLSAVPAADLAARGAQHFRRQFEDGLAFRALREQLKRLFERRCSTNRRALRLAPYQKRRRKRPLPHKPGSSRVPTAASILPGRRQP